MNPVFIKNEIEQHIGKRVFITQYGMRNRTNTYRGIIKAVYPNIFTILEGNNEKSFKFSDVITGDIKLQFSQEIDE